MQSAPAQQIPLLETLLSQLKSASSNKEKLSVLQRNVDSNDLKKVHHLLTNLTESQKLAILSLLALKQAPVVFKGLSEITLEQLTPLANTLADIDSFYASIGGLIGYHLLFLKSIVAKQQPPKSLPAGVQYLMPVGTDLTKDTPEVRKSIRWGIEAIPYMAELYPVGGSGDRLNLLDDAGNALPVAELTFCGHTLLEGLVRDLQSREYLHYKLDGNQVTTPIAMMTSLEKNNHEHIVKLCERHHWFGRDRASFKLFTQPLVPVINAEGEWVVTKPLELMLKPGGHGVLWKLALREGVLDWFTDSGRSYCLVRQINNPVASIDHGLLAFIGIGYHEMKIFGFASCYRVLNSAEGMDVLIEKESDNGVEYCLTNVEYTEFEQHGLKDVPEAHGSPYSRFPSNTNILCANLQAMKSIAKESPIPGLLINMKTTVPHTLPNGRVEQIAVGRLESTMQNIADYIVDHYPIPLMQVEPKDLSSYITFNERRKTLSVTKKGFVPGNALLETPEGCFYELMQNHYDLFTNYCKMGLPSMPSEREFLNHEPPFVVSYHPALGPLYSVIAQKIQGGALQPGSELQLEIAELQMENVHIDGSLLIVAEAVIGHQDSEGHIVYSENTGKCILKNVRVKNKGIDRKAQNQFWSHKIVRSESLRIQLIGNGEFVAENVEFIGGIDLVVPSGHRMVASMKNGEVVFSTEKIGTSSWFWDYVLDAQDKVLLHLVKN